MSPIPLAIAFACFLLVAVIGTWTKDYQSATVHAILTLAVAVLLAAERRRAQ